MARPISDVTGDNFAKKGADYMKLHETGFVIALRRYPGLPADDKFTPTPRQWGAWMAYWARLPYKTKSMQSRGYATTPAEWPHEFDANATMQGDYGAGEAFERRWRNERESQTFHAGGLVGQASKAVAMWNASRGEKRAKTPAPHLEPEATPAVDFSDFPDASWTREEMKAWEARQKVTA